MASDSTTARVPVKSAWFSKINWGEGAKVAALVSTMLGVPQELQADILAAIIGIGSLYTWIVRTWYTSEVTKGSVP